MRTKICTLCGKELPATTEYFHRQKMGKYGLHSRCKECANEVNRRYYIPQAVNEYAIYQGDEFLGVGTARELARSLGIKPQTVYTYGTPSHIKRTCEEKGRRLIKLD